MLTIVQPGLLTTIQDLGAGGAMDFYAHRISNLLVGNDENEATLEITLLGPVIKMNKDVLISICGADLSPAINGVNVPLGRPIFVKHGSILQFGNVVSGCRTYLAVAGGFDIPEVIGGFNGRPLQRGDVIRTKVHNSLNDKICEYVKRKRHFDDFNSTSWFTALHAKEDAPFLRVMKGRQFNFFSYETRKLFFEEGFKVTTQSDRMGCRLSGPNLQWKKHSEMISEGMSFGSIQVPSDGNPIILLADGQTTGSYPRIAQIITVDLPLAAQMKPNDIVRFKEVSLREARKFYIKQEERIREFKVGIKLKVNRE